MLCRVLTVWMFLLPIYPMLEAGVWDNIKEFIGIQKKIHAPLIKVLIAHDIEAANLEVQGKYSLYDPYTNSHISTRFVGKSKTIQGLRSGIKWGEEFPGLYQIKIVPEDENSRIIVDGMEYSGSIYIYDIGGSISIVNETNIEQYLHSTVASQFNPSIPGEALAAFVIAARTNAYAQAANPKNTYWSVDAQRVGYRGNDNVEDADWARKAVNVTQYMILSRTGIYEGLATPFPLQWGPISGGGKSTDEQPARAAIGMEEADRLAQEGMHAAQILSKAFPKATIMLMRPSSL